MNEAKITVAVTCYNHEAYIEECLRSIFRQSYQNIELLIFNDGSTDDSGEIIEGLLPESPFAETHYFSAPNQGIAAVRNAALDKMTGDYLLFVDSDNFIDENHVQILLSNMTETGADVAYCQLWDFEGQKNVLADDLTFSLDKMLAGNLIDASSLVRADKLQDIRFDLQLNRQSLEDYDFWLNLIVNHGAKPHFVQDTKLNYRLTKDSRSERGNWERYYQSYFYILDKYTTQLPNEVSKALQTNVQLWLKNYLKAEQVSAERAAALADKDKIISEKDAHIATQAEMAEKALHDKDVAISDRDKEIENKEGVIRAKDAELQALINSKAFRLGNKMLHPLRKKQ